MITNGSLLWRPEVMADLVQADTVSVKVDAAGSAAWRRLNRPDDRLEYLGEVFYVRSLAGW